jgi:hypothetical protein
LSLLILTPYFIIIDFIEKSILKKVNSIIIN